MFTSDEDVALYRDAYSPLWGEQEEKIASAPVLSGSVVLDLKRMNRILDVHERDAYALVEPGVSHFDLYRYIQERGLRLWIDCPDPGCSSTRRPRRAGHWWHCGTREGRMDLVQPRIWSRRSRRAATRWTGSLQNG